MCQSGFEMQRQTVIFYQGKEKFDPLFVLEEKTQRTQIQR